MENDLKIKISVRLKEIRNARHMSQEEVRNRTCIDVSCYESGKRLPKIDTLHELAKLYEVKITYFLEGVF